MACQCVRASVESTRGCGGIQTQAPFACGRRPQRTRNQTSFRKRWLCVCVRKRGGGLTLRDSLNTRRRRRGRRGREYNQAHSQLAQSAHVRADPISAVDLLDL